MRFYPVSMTPPLLCLKTRASVLLPILVVLAGCTREAQRAFIVAVLFLMLGVAVLICGVTALVIALVRKRPTNGRITVGFLWSLTLGGFACAPPMASDFSLDPASTEFLWSATSLFLPGVLALVTLAFSIAAIRNPPPAS